jgi:hypothetical protein
MPDILPLGQSNFIRFGLYGISGIGKTRFVGSGDNTLIIRPPTEHTDSIRGGAARGVVEVVVRNWDDMNDVYEHLAADGKQYDWVWLDSASAFQDTGLDDLWEQVKAEKPHRARFGLDKGEYGINMHRFGVWMREVIGLESFHFGFTAHPFEGAAPGDDDSLMWMPYVQGKGMAQKFCGYMNVVGHYQIKKIKAAGDTKAVPHRVINFEATEDYYAKDQFDAFKNHRLIDPDMPSFMKAVEAARTRNGAGTRKASKGRKTTPKKGNKKR